MGSCLSCDDHHDGHHRRHHGHDKHYTGHHNKHYGKYYRNDQCTDTYRRDLDYNYQSGQVPTGISNGTLQQQPTILPAYNTSIDAAYVEPVEPIYPPNPTEEKREAPANTYVYNENDRYRYVLLNPNTSSYNNPPPYNPAAYS